MGQLDARRNARMQETCPRSDPDLARAACWGQEGVLSLCGEFQGTPLNIGTPAMHTEATTEAAIAMVNMCMVTPSVLDTFEADAQWVTPLGNAHAW